MNSKVVQQMIDDANTDKLELLNSQDYPAKAGMLRAEAQILRRTLAGLIEALEERETIIQPGVKYRIESAKIDLEKSAYLLADFNYYPGESNAERPLGDGRFKNGNTGEVYELDTRTADDCRSAG